MSWSVEWTRPAVGDLRRLDRSVESRVRTALRRLAEENEGDVTRLRGVAPPEWRLRVGDWRVRFTYDFGTQTIQVLHVLHRREAYR